jgi:hypothetical protein
MKQFRIDPFVLTAVLSIIGVVLALCYGIDWWLGIAPLATYLTVEILITLFTVLGFIAKRILIKMFDKHLE